jgi:hypothetical protein
MGLAQSHSVVELAVFLYWVLKIFIIDSRVIGRGLDILALDVLAVGRVADRTCSRAGQKLDHDF